MIIYLAVSLLDTGNLEANFCKIVFLLASASLSFFVLLFLSTYTWIVLHILYRFSFFYSRTRLLLARLFSYFVLFLVSLMTAIGWVPGPAKEVQHIFHSSARVVLCHTHAWRYVCCSRATTCAGVHSSCTLYLCLPFIMYQCTRYILRAVHIYRYRAFFQMPVFSECNIVMYSTHDSWFGHFEFSLCEFATHCSLFLYSVSSVVSALLLFRLPPFRDSDPRLHSGHRCGLAQTTCLYLSYPCWWSHRRS